MAERTNISLNAEYSEKIEKIRIDLEAFYKKRLSLAFAVKYLIDNTNIARI